MNLKTKIVIISVTAIIVLLFFSILVLKSKEIKDKNFDLFVENIDSNWNKYSSLEIVDFLVSGEDLVNSSSDYKRLLKRIYSTGNWNYLSSLSEKAYLKYSKDEQIFAIYIQSLLLSNNPEKANNILLKDKNNIISDNFQLQAAIGSDIIISDDNIFYKVLKEKSTTLFEKLFEITLNEYFLIDAGLIYLEQGDYEKADYILSSLNNSNTDFKRLLLFTKYYNSKYKEVDKLLLKYDFNFSIEELNLFRIDTSLKQNLYRHALELNLQFLNLYPNYSVNPYINLILLSYYIDVPDVISVINSSITLFKNDKNLLFIIAKYLEENNRVESSISLLENYLLNNTNDKEIEIILKELKGTENPENFINNVRNFVNLNPEDMNAAKYLSWKMFENGKFNNLDNFLQIEKNNYSWVLFFKAIVACSQGDYNKSIDLLQSAYVLEGKWEYLYNLGVLFENTNQYQNAIQHYQNAENLLDNTMYLETKSLIRTTLAELMYNMKNYNSAYRELNIALDMNPHNLKANLLLKKLESSRN